MNDGPAASTRNESLDVARGLGMILVIYGHVLQILFHRRMDGGFSEAAFAQWQAIYGFHMPLFFLVSGAIAGQFSGKNWRQVASRSVQFVLVAYFVDALGTLITLFQQGAPALAAFRFRDYLVNHVLLAEAFSTITVWFLVAFAIVRMAAYALLRHGGMMRWFVAALLILSFMLSYQWTNAWHLRAVAPGVVFFLLGRLWAMRPVDVGLPAAFLLLALSLWSAQYNGGCTFSWETSCDNAELPGRFAVLMIFGFYGNLPLFFATALTGSLAVLAIAGRLAGTRLSPPIAFIGRNTLALLIINGFCLVFVNPILRDRVEIHETFGFYVALAAPAVLGHLAVLYLAKPLLWLIDLSARMLAGLVVGLVWLPWAGVRAKLQPAGAET